VILVPVPHNLTSSGILGNRITRTVPVPSICVLSVNRVLPVTLKGSIPCKSTDPGFYGPSVKQRPINTFNNHMLTENLLIQTKFEDKLRLESCLDNIYLPGLIVTRLKFQKELLKMKFSEGCLKMMSIPNAGGSSLISEVISFEMLQAFCKARLCKTEMEIFYME
jgi:hypothetical protein